MREKASLKRKVRCRDCGREFDYGDDFVHRDLTAHKEFVPVYGCF